MTAPITPAERALVQEALAPRNIPCPNVQWAAWLAGYEAALEEAEREAAAGDANWQDCEENRLHHFQRAETAERELERWKHNLQVEGDYVCPDSLRADAAESRVKDLEDEARTCRGGHNHNTLRKLNAEVARLQEEGARLREALRSMKSQLTQYWAYLSSDRVEDAEAILDAALARATGEDVDHG